MSAFVSTPPAPASPPASVVEAGAFWPAIDVNNLRGAVRLGDGVVTHDRLIAAIEGAVIAAMHDLAAWQARQIAAGHATCAAAAAGQLVGGAAVTTVLWQRAVRYYTAAELADGHPDLTATNEGTQRAQDKRSVADDYRRMATTAIRGFARYGAPDPDPDAPASAGANLVDLI